MLGLSEQERDGVKNVMGNDYTQRQYKFLEENILKVAKLHSKVFAISLGIHFNLALRQSLGSH